MLVAQAQPVILAAAAVLAALAPQPSHQRQEATAVPGELRQSQALHTLVAVVAARSVPRLEAADLAAVALAGPLVLRERMAPLIRAAVAVAAVAAQTSQAATAGLASLC
jgi:hypothetical protein